LWIDMICIFKLALFFHLNTFLQNSRVTFCEIFSISECACCLWYFTPEMVRKSFLHRLHSNFTGLSSTDLSVVSVPAVRAHRELLCLWATEELCLSNLDLDLNDTWQILHSCVGFLWTVLLCLLSTSSIGNVLKHSLHSKFLLTFSCFNSLWYSNFVLLSNFVEHLSHSNSLKILSWTLSVCFFRLYFSLKEVSHLSHLNGFAISIEAWSFYVFQGENCL